MHLDRGRAGVQERGRTMITSRVSRGTTRVSRLWSPNRKPSTKTSSRTIRALFAVIVAAALTTGSAVGAQAAASPSSDPPAASPPWTSTVRYLVGQLTVDEKISLVHGALGQGIVTPTTPTDPEANGAIGVVSGVARLGIPTVRHVDSHGVNLFADSTAYPGRLGVAAAFARAAGGDFGHAGWREGRSLGAALIYAPQTDLTRLPTWAR